MIHPFVVILPSAGSGSRFGDSTPKQYLSINGKFVLDYSLEIFLSFEQCKKVVIMISQDDSHHSDLMKDDRVSCINGGSNRAESVKLGFDYLTSLGIEEDILIHDAARPCLRIEEVVEFLKNFYSSQSSGSIFAIPCSDTIKQSSDAKIIDHSVNRSELWLAQTPQIFRFSELTNAYKLNKHNLNELTDESSLFDLLNKDISLFKSSTSNIKLTYKEDISLAEAIINSNRKEN